MALAKDLSDFAGFALNSATNGLGAVASIPFTFGGLGELFGFGGSNGYTFQDSKLQEALQLYRTQVPLPSSHENETSNFGIPVRDLSLAERYTLNSANEIKPGDPRYLGDPTAYNVRQAQADTILFRAEAGIPSAQNVAQSPKEFQDIYNMPYEELHYLRIITDPANEDTTTQRHAKDNAIATGTGWLQAWGPPPPQYLDAMNRNTAPVPASAPPAPTASTPATASTADTAKTTPGAGFNPGAGGSAGQGQVSIPSWFQPPTPAPVSQDVAYKLDLRQKAVASNDFFTQSLVRKSGYLQQRLSHPDYENIYGSTTLGNTGNVQKASLLGVV